MALTADIKVDERIGGKRFAYGLKAGVKLYRGSVIAVTSAGLVVRVGDSGAAAIVGISQPSAYSTARAKLRRSDATGSGPASRPPIRQTGRHQTPHHPT
jgi:hypothetical protein